MPENIEKHPDVKHGDEMLRQYRREGHMLRRFTEFTNSIVAAAYEGQKALLDRSPEALTRLFGVRDAVVYTPDAMRRRLPLDGLSEDQQVMIEATIRGGVRQRRVDMICEPLFTPKSLGVTAPIGAILLIWREHDNRDPKDFNLLDPAARLLGLSIFNAINGALAQRLGGRQIQRLMIEDPQRLFERGKRRNTSVLFADVVGSTELSQLHEPEVVYDAINAYLSAAGDAIVRFDVYVDSLPGDGLMATFNAFGLQERLHAPLAVATGLLMQYRFKALSRVRLQLTQENVEVLPILQYRIGIDTSTDPSSCIVGPIGIMNEQVNRTNYTALGETPNRAARVEHEGIADEVVITGSVIDSCKEGGYELICRPYATRELKGITNPVPLYVVKDFSDPYAYQRLEENVIK